MNEIKLTLEQYDALRNEISTLKAEISTLKAELKRRDDISEKRRNAVKKRRERPKQPKDLRTVIAQSQRQEEKERQFQVSLYRPEEVETNLTFDKPSGEQVYEYMHMYTMGAHYIDARNEARQFLDYYDANGWVIGRTPMRDWQAAARNWINMRTRNFNGDLQKQASYENTRNYLEAVRNIRERESRGETDFDIERYY